MIIHKLNLAYFRTAHLIIDWVLYVFDSNQPSDFDKENIPEEVLQVAFGLPLEGICGIMSAKYNLKHGLECSMKLLLQNCEINYKKTHNLDALLKQMNNNFSKLKISKETLLLWKNFVEYYKYESNHLNQKIEDYCNDLNRYGSNKNSHRINTKGLFEIERKELVKIKEDVNKARDIYWKMSNEQQGLFR